MTLWTRQLVSTPSRIHDVFSRDFRTIVHPSSSPSASFTDGSRLPLSIKKIGSTVIETSLLHSESPNNWFVVHMQQTLMLFWRLLKYTRIWRSSHDGTYAWLRVGGLLDGSMLKQRMCALQSFSPCSVWFVYFLSRFSHLIRFAVVTIICEYLIHLH